MPSRGKRRKRRSESSRTRFMSFRGNRRRPVGKRCKKQARTSDEARLAETAQELAKPRAKAKPVPVAAKLTTKQEIAQDEERIAAAQAELPASRTTPPLEPPPRPREAEMAKDARGIAQAEATYEGTKDEPHATGTFMDRE